MKPSLRPSTRRSTLLVLAAAVLALPAAARQAGAVATMPSAREVVDRHAAACKLREVLAKTQSMHARGEVSIPAMGIKGTLETFSAKPASNRMSMEMGPAGTMSGGCDGTVAWTSTSFQGARLLQGTELLTSRLDADWFAPLREGEAYESLRTVGREPFEGKECWKIEVVARPLSGMDADKTREARTVHEYYEIESGLLLGSKARLEGEGGSVAATQVFSDYKDMGGRLVATKTLVREAGQEIVLRIDSVEFDTVTPEALRPPPEVQALLAPPKQTPPKPATPQ